MKYCCSHSLASYDALDVSASSSSDFVAAGIVEAYPPSLLIEPVHIDISASFDFEKESYHGTVITTFKRTAAASVKSAKDLRQFSLNAVSFSNVKVSGDKLDDFEYDGEKIHLYWKGDFSANEERKVTVEYDIIKPIAGLYWAKSYHTTNSAKNVIADHETERARYWLPSCDVPTARATLSYHLTAPEGMEAFANGMFEGKEKSAHGTVYHYTHDFRCPTYLMAFSVGDFEVVQDKSVDKMPIAYIASKGTDPANIKRSFDDTPAIVEWMRKKVGNEFPWIDSKYYQIATETIGGAMECETFVTWQSLDFVASAEEWEERQRSLRGVNVHEMAHSYFGDALVCRFFEHSWLKESWATVMELFYAEDHYGKDAYDYHVMINAEQYFDECKDYVRPIVTRTYEHSWSLFDRHLYPGGSVRIHMLRRLLGDEAFWAGVQDYIKTYKGKVVETDDFRKKLEEHSGHNLTEFFDQWLYGKGYPKLKISHDYDRDAGIVNFTVEQTQKDEKKGIKYFTMDLDIQVNTEQGETLSTIVRLVNSRKDGFASVTLPKGSKISFIRLDPDNKVVFDPEFKPGVALLNAALTKSKDVRNRIWALRGLVDIGSYESIKNLRDAMASEQSYNVRQQSIKALAKNKSALALEAASEILLAEKEIPAFFAMITYISGVRDPIIRNTLELLLAKGLPPFATTRALMALGKQRNPQDVKYLLSVAKDTKPDGQWYRRQRGAMQGLGASGSPDAFQYLLDRVNGPITPTVFAWKDSLNALATCANYQPKESRKLAIEAISPHLQSVDDIIKNTARKAIVTLGAIDQASTILATRPNYAAQDWPSVLASVKSLRAANSEQAGGKVSALSAQIESLEEKLRKLEAKVEASERKAQTQADATTSAAAPATETST